MTTVREATFSIMRDLGLRTIFANPGSTEVPFLVDLADDFRFVLGLHESSVVGMATGHALAGGRPAFVNVHTAAGLGNATGALATARQNRAPLVVVVGQQDRRHLAAEPFLSGPLDRMADPYPVLVETPGRAQDVPGSVARAYHAAAAELGPALVIVPMDDWAAPYDEAPGLTAPAHVVNASGVDPAAVVRVADMVRDSGEPVLVVGAGADDQHTWAALQNLAERLECPVWQEPFGSRAGFPQDHRLFRGHLPAGRARLRAALAAHDLVLVVGAPVFRQYAYEPGAFVDDPTTVVQVTDQAAEARHAAAQLSLLAPLAPFVAALAGAVPARSRHAGHRLAEAPSATAPVPGGLLRAEDVVSALAARVSADCTIVEETPSSRPTLLQALPARQPLGFLSAAGGGLGFALPAAVGVKMARRNKPVVAVVGDGSSLYSVQALWSAARYDVGVLVVVLANGGYQILNRLVERFDEDAKAPWPDFPEVRVTALAQGLGCPAVRISTWADLTRTLDEVVPTLASRTSPLVLEVVVEPETGYQP